jgi:hypothetical protein
MYGNWPPKECGDAIGHLQEAIRLLKLVQKTPQNEYNKLNLNKEVLEVAALKLKSCVQNLPED